VHDAEHERWLEGVAGGGAAAERPDVAERLARCPECRAAHARLAHAAARVAAAAREREAVLAEARALCDAPGEERAAERLRALLREGAPRPTPPGAAPRTVTGAPVPARRRAWPWLAVLAAAAVIALLLLRDRVERPAPDPGPVLGEPLRLVRPIGDGVGSYSPFEWSAAPERGQRFELVVEGYDPALERWTEAWKRDVEGTSHAITPEEEARLPARIRWRIRATRPGVSGASVAEAEASR
jgi:hypothetical protein